MCSYQGPFHDYNCQECGQDVELPVNESTGEPYCAWCTDGIDCGPFCGLAGCKPEVSHVR